MYKNKKVFLIAPKAVIINPKGKILILRRSKKEMDGSHPSVKTRWDLPGGTIRFREKTIEGLLREIREETGLSKIRVIKPYSVFDSIRENFHITIINYVCTTKNSNIKLSHEHSDYRWASIDELSKLNVPFWMQNSLLKALNEYHLTKKNN